MREIYDYDKAYLTGAKAPLIIRMPHARARPTSSLCFEAFFQLLICLLITSKLKNLETSSYFTYNDRTKNLSIPTQDKGITSVLLSDKLKTIDKSM